VIAPNIVFNLKKVSASNINKIRKLNYFYECLTIIYDQIDHVKTNSPIFLYKSKQLNRLIKIPVSVMDTIAHGHGDVPYVHYSLDIFFHDSNYIVGSFVKLLQDFELLPKYSS